MRRASRRIIFTAALAAASLAAAMLASAALAALTVDKTAGPNGANIKGTPSCALASDNTVTCSSYDISGVGNTNANGGLTATYSATVNCTNHGGQLVPVKSSVQTAGTTTGNISPTNGRMTVPSLNSGPGPTNDQFLAAATCPNGNWTKSLAPGNPTLTSFTYTLHFVGFTGNFITITGP